MQYLTDSSLRIGTAQINPARSLIRDWSNEMTMVWDDFLNIDLSSSGAGGLDVGSVAADKNYAIYIIGDLSGDNDPVGIASLDGNEPNYPSGYDARRRIGFVRTDGSADIIRFESFGEGSNRWFQFAGEKSETQILAGGSNTSYTQISLTYVPLPYCRRVYIHGEYAPQAAGNSCRIQVSGSPAATLPYREYYGPAPSRLVSFDFDIIVGLVQTTIDYEVDAVGDSLDLYVTGYEHIL